MAEQHDIFIEKQSPDTALRRAKERLEMHTAQDAASLRNKAQWLRKHMPAKAESIIRQADLVMEGKYILPGTGGKPYLLGTPPCWDENPLGDNEFVWKLNRMHALETLMKAYLLTENEPYCDRALFLWEHWIDNCIRPSMEFLRTKGHGGSSVSGWRSFEAGLRMSGSWAFALKCLLALGKLPPALYQKILISAHQHGECLSELPLIYWPKKDSNHYLVQMAGLLSLSLLFPELKNAGVWKKQAIEELELCCASQITEEGGHYEGCPGYHLFCLSLLYDAFVRAKSFGVSFSGTYEKRLRKAVDYALYCTAPTGFDVQWGDSIFRNQSGLRAALIGYLLSGDTTHLRLAKTLTGTEALKSVIGDMLWDIGKEHDAERLLSCGFPESKATGLPLVHFQKSLDQFMARSHWGREALSLFFACHLPVNLPHAHIDPMGFDFTALGETLIKDPGVFSYREGTQREKYKSAPWHSTLLVNDKPPFAYITSWEYGPQKEGCILRQGTKDRLAYAEAVHHSYEPAVHKRFIALAGDEALIILDRVENLTEKDFVRLYNHLDTLDVTMIGENMSESRHGNVWLCSVFSDNLHCEILDGSISETIDRERASKRLCLTDDGKESTRIYASVFLPRKDRKAQRLTIESFCYDEKQITLTAWVEGKTISFEIANK